MGMCLQIHQLCGNKYEVGVQAGNRKIEVIEEEEKTSKQKSLQQSDIIGAY